jgi:hypothetical protein
MKMNVVLTVSESKRVIAKGIVKWDLVREALEKRTVAIAKGTTNSYIAEEILGKGLDKRSYCTGVTLPERTTHKGATSAKLPDLVLKKGERLDVSVTDAVKEMGPGDVFMKGANALNYERRQAAVLIGHPTGGTVGATIGTVTARRIQWVIPVGLEKSVPVDLEAAARRMNQPDDETNYAPCLWPVNGLIFTEIEAVRVLTGAEAMPVSAGGIGGAEGSVRLLVCGDRNQLENTEKILEGIRGEPAFIA